MAQDGLKTSESLHRSPGHDRRPADLWAASCYFNPAGYKSRIKNYRTFRQHLAVPLVTVELSFNGRFELTPSDADIVVQLHGKDVLWHKERLLNLAFKEIPDDCDKIAWLDCDVIFASDDWWWRAERALNEFPLIHLYTERRDLARSAVWGSSIQVESTMESEIYRISQRTMKIDDIGIADAPISRNTAVGLAWAAHRSCLEKHGLYEACIMGGADRVMFCAALGRFDCAINAHKLHSSRREHFLAWAEPYFKSICGRVGFIEGTIWHLWHGDLADRHYPERPKLMNEFSFDPYEDIALDENGVIVWNSNKPRMHQVVREYFTVRKEDG